MREKIADLPGNSQANPSPVRLLSGELLKQDDLDCLVSFLTEDLSWGGPLNQKLISINGRQLDDYVLSHILRPAPGIAFSTPAFALPCKGLIFGVIPKWDDGFAHEEKYLKRAVRNIVQLAEKLEYLTIGIPAVGHGNDKMPLRKGARVVHNSLRDVNLSAFSEIRIVCKGEAALEAYCERFSSQKESRA